MEKDEAAVELLKVYLGSEIFDELVTLVETTDPNEIDLTSLGQPLHEAGVPKKIIIAFARKYAPKAIERAIEQMRKILKDLEGEGE